MLFFLFWFFFGLFTCGLFRDGWVACFGFQSAYFCFFLVFLNNRPLCNNLIQLFNKLNISKATQHLSNYFFDLNSFFRLLTLFKLDISYFFQVWADFSKILASFECRFVLLLINKHFTLNFFHMLRELCSDKGLKI